MHHRVRAILPLALPPALVIAALVMMTALVGILPGAASAAPRDGRAVAAHGTSTDTFEARTLVAVNAVRDRHGLRPIKRVLPCLDGLSESWGTRMATEGLWEHRDMGSVVSSCRLRWTGETLARGRFSPRGLVGMWMDSPPHRAVLLTPAARLAGIDVRRGPGGDYSAVLNLGARR